MYAALRHPQQVGQRVAGLVGMSCFVPHAEVLTSDAGVTWGDTPVLLLHGEQDETVAPEMAHKSLQVFQTLGGSNIDFIEYAFLKHGVNMLELKDLANFVKPKIASSQRSWWR
mmetsp:Transcript_42115/g.78826  ORF Transcript_42115/g.78826 Transcript_42115/m.78826 type:complete len:113 (-) Transcript_42115:81-419(-)